MKPVFEKVRLAENQSFSCLEFKGAVFDCPYHIHPEIELTYIASSSGRRITGDSTNSFHSGDFAVFAGNLPHMYYNQPTESPHDKWAHSQYIQFHEDCFGNEFMDIPEMGDIRRLLARARRGLYLDASKSKPFARKLEKVFAAQGPLRICAFIELLTQLARSRSLQVLTSEQYIPVESHLDSERLTRVMNYINTHFDSPMRLASVARVAGLSPEAFSRFFHRVMGQRYVDYINLFRISEACRMLIERDASVAEVCFACGYSNLSNFNRQFKKVKGCAPTTYRRSLEITPTRERL